MKNVTFFILVVLLVQFSFSQTMTVHKTDHTIIDFSLSQIDSITFSVSVQEIPLELANWKCYIQTIPQYVSPTPGVYEKVADGLKIYGSGYRGGALIHPTPTSQYPIMNKTIFMKWKANGGGNFMGVGLLITTDTVTWAYPDSGIMNLTTNHSYLSSYVITEDSWYYTRVLVTSNSYTATTATGNYDNLGGVVIQTKTRPIAVTYKVVVFRLFDTYAGTTPYAILGEARIE